MHFSLDRGHIKAWIISGQEEEAAFETFKYPADFRAHAVELVRRPDRPVAKNTEELDLSHEMPKPGFVRSAAIRHRGRSDDVDIGGDLDPRPPRPIDRQQPPPSVRRAAEHIPPHAPLHVFADR
ncbi:hypothetical protein GCM10023196_079690 [Actinoallomurus vinaceus]|uniref:Uncharacterized protein n=1 Tax=Actinoallomurus vinaceus TaxID=1080074 RepID=A0ABP8UPU7_9ACTN